MVLLRKIFQMVIIDLSLLVSFDNNFFKIFNYMIKKILSNFLKILNPILVILK